MNITLRLECSSDSYENEAVTREAFWDVYHPGCSEHYIQHKLRTHPDLIPELNFVAVDGDQIVGNIVYSKGVVTDEHGISHSVLIFGPVSVLPSYQKQGIGTMLIEHTLKLAKDLRYPGVIIFGNPDYYHRFGFQNAQQFGITTADGQNFDAFMALELYPNALNQIQGKFQESNAFSFNQEQVDEFDQKFPPKEKHITNTQLS